MNEPLMDIERVVREVLAELAAAQAGSTADEGRGAGEKKCSPKAERSTEDNEDAATNGDLVVGGRLVTLADVDGRLGTARRLIVSQKAVVTPAVRDELLRRKIALAYMNPAGEKAAGMRVAMIASGTDFALAGLSDALARADLAVEPSTSDCLIAARRFRRFPA